MTATKTRRKTVQRQVTTEITKLIKHLQAEVEFISCQDFRDAETRNFDHYALQKALDLLRTVSTRHGG